MPVVRPDKANVLPTDLGTKSIAEVCAVWDQLHGPPATGGNIRPDDFSQLTNEERVKVVERGRKIANDRFVAVRHVLQNLISIFLVNKGLGWVLGKLLGARGAGIVAKILIATGLYYRWKAWERLSDRPYKGPPLYPFLGVLPDMVKNIEVMHNFLLDMTRKTGFESLEVPVPMACFVTLMDPRDREYVLKTNPWNYLKNRHEDPACFERVFAEVLGRGIFSTDGSEWLNARKVASHMFSGTALRNQMEDVFNQHADRLLQLLKTKVADTNRVVDIQDVYQSVVFDGFCEIAFGVHPNCIASAIEGTRPQFLVSFDLAQQISAARVLAPPLTWNINRLLGIYFGIGQEAELVKHLNVIDDYIYSIIDARLKETDVSSRKDLLSLYIQYSRSQSQPFTREDYRDIIANFMIAGRDTTSCTLSYVTKYLGENPAISKRLGEEGLYELGAATRKDHGGRRVVSWEESRSIPYVDAVVNEVLRMAPPVSLLCNPGKIVPKLTC
jgi:cytochrome P450